MKKVFKIVLLIIVLCSSVAKGQDMHFTQFYASPLYLNPAFAGANVCSRVSLTYRNQWPGISKTYKSFLVSVDHSVQKYNLGVGFLLGSDVAGSGDLRTTLINPMISYGVKINRKLGLRFGFLPGIGMRSIDYTKLVFGDQIARGGGGVASIEDPTQNKVFIDIGAGALFFSEKYWLGTSFSHLTGANTTLVDNEAILPLKYSLHGGVKIILNENKGNILENRSISPAFHYRGQKEFDQFDLGFYFTQHVFNIGLWYRGLPGIKEYKPGYPNNDAFSVTIGVQADRVNVGYSYDVTISYLKHDASKGAHEITLSYQLCKLKKRRKKHGLVIPCPKF